MTIIGNEIECKFTMAREIQDYFLTKKLHDNNMLYNFQIWCEVAEKSNFYKEGLSKFGIHETAKGSKPRRCVSAYLERIVGKPFSNLEETSYYDDDYLTYNLLNQFKEGENSTEGIYKLLYFIALYLDTLICEEVFSAVQLNEGLKSVIREKIKNYIAQLIPMFSRVGPGFPGKTTPLTEQKSEKPKKRFSFSIFSFEKNFFQ